MLLASKPLAERLKGLSRLCNTHAHVFSRVTSDQKTNAHPRDTSARDQQLITKRQSKLRATGHELQVVSVRYCICQRRKSAKVICKSSVAPKQIKCQIEYPPTPPANQLPLRSQKERSANFKGQKLRYK